MKHSSGENPGYLTGVSDARQDAVDALLQHMASMCARATADESHAAGKSAGRSLARRCLLETCDLVAHLQPACSCAGIEFLLMHLVKVGQVFCQYGLVRERLRLDDPPALIGGMKGQEDECQMVKVITRVAK